MRCETPVLPVLKNRRDLASSAASALSFCCWFLGTAIWEVASHVQALSVDGHADDGVDAHAIEAVDLLLRDDATGDDQLAGGGGAQRGHALEGEAGHGSFAVNVGVEKRRAVGMECAGGVGGSKL